MRHDIAMEAIVLHLATAAAQALFYMWLWHTYGAGVGLLALLVCEARVIMATYMRTKIERRKFTGGW